MKAKMKAQIADLAEFRRGSQNPIDILVGKNVKLRRAQSGFSQTELANTLGITFQQVQKYEKGSNRIGASRLYIISQILSCTVFDLYDGIDDIGLDISNEDEKSLRAIRVSDFISTPQGVNLCEAVSRMGSATRTQFVKLAVAIADGTD